MYYSNYQHFGAFRATSVGFIDEDYLEEILVSFAFEFTVFQMFYHITFA